MSLEAGGVLEHRRVLDLRQGVLWREWRQQDPSGRITRLSYLQLASLADRHVLLQTVAVTAENYQAGWALTIGLAPSDLTRTDTALIAAERTPCSCACPGPRLRSPARPSCQAQARRRVTRADRAR